MAEARSANAALEGEIARLQEELHSERALSLNLHKTLAEERARSEHLNILLKQFRDECATPFVVPAIVARKTSTPAPPLRARNRVRWPADPDEPASPDSSEPVRVHPQRWLGRADLSLQCRRCADSPPSSPRSTVT